ncbi:hypothetical protein ANN_20403 [Periplaneta americana]|uniref:PiggyBac transposable element-derived protein domain-containing protein n=1 Tax=Periplaneta americana TaxID=6978 RepID=A0ABQ8SD02_PERAM|nr:hypothetical protein ANN_20403 [Periplaneta americana]
MLGVTSPQTSERTYIKGRIFDIQRVTVFDKEMQPCSPCPVLTLSIKVRKIDEVGWLDEEDEQEIIQGESEDEGDHISESEHNTDTEQEQEADSSDDDCDDNAPLSQFTTYKGKDGTSRRKSVPPRNVKTRACNIVTHLPGCKGQARQAKLPLDTWLCLIDDNIIDDIFKYTNIYIRSIQNNFVCERDVSITDQTEIKELFGLLYFAGALRKVTQLLNIAPSNERLEPFRGHCLFGQLIKSKPAQYGIKVFGLADSRTFCVLNLEIYCGMQPEGQYCQSNSPSDVVKRLISPISGTGRNVMFDNWFMSVPLAKELLSDHNLTCVGTVRLNKREILPEFVQKRREQFSSIFGFQDRLTLTSYVPKPRKVVLVASTMHYDDAIDPDTREEKKPEIIMFYNATKGGIDVVDELCGPIIRRSFLKELALGLVKNHLAHRLTLKNLPLEIRSTIGRMNGVEELTQPTQKRMKMSSSGSESLMLAGNEFQSLGRAIVKEDEYEEMRWDGIVSIVSWQERVFRLWWEER